MNAVLKKISDYYWVVVVLIFIGIGVANIGIERDEGYSTISTHFSHESKFGIPCLVLAWILYKIKSK